MTMYLEHFGLREAPFRITPHTEFFFATYRPHSFAIGAWVSLASLAVWLGLLCLRRPIRLAEADPRSLSYPPRSEPGP